MNRPPRRSLTDVLNGSGGSIREVWNTIDAAGDDKPIPRGEYICHLVRTELFSAGTSTPGYKMTFEVVEGDHAGRLLWYDLWLTVAAAPRTKRDLAKIGITALEQTEKALPAPLKCKVLVALKKDEDGIERNQVRRFEVLGVVDTKPNPFPPADEDEDGEDNVEGIPV